MSKYKATAVVPVRVTFTYMWDEDGKPPTEHLEGQADDIVDGVCRTAPSWMDTSNIEDRPRVKRRGNIEVEDLERVSRGDSDE